MTDPQKLINLLVLLVHSMNCKQCWESETKTFFSLSLFVGQVSQLRTERKR